MPEDPLGIKFDDEDEKKKEMFETIELLQPVLMSFAAQRADESDIERVKIVHD